MSFIHNRVVPLGPDIPGILLLYDVYIIYLAYSYTYRVLLPLQQLLLFVIVCRMAKIVAVSLKLIR